MENYSYSSYPDSHDSSPRSRENESWDDQQPSTNYKVKFMCSYGGKIHPRPHDNQLTYVGGETKILAVDRNIRFSSIISKLSSFCDNEVCFKYQLPGEDLDALISVTNDEDLEHMMLEYDRIYRVGGGGSRPARLRLFLFPLISSNQSSFSADDPKPSQQWFVDALNAVPIQSLDASSPPASATNTDFLFGGFDKQQQNQLPQVAAPPAIPPVTKLIDPKPETLITPEPKIIPDDRNIGAGGGEMFEIQRQIQELQRLQIVNQEQQQQAQVQQALYQRKNEANMNPNLARGAAFHGGAGDYYIPDKQIPVSLPPTGYWPDRHSPVTGGYPEQMTGTDRQQQQQQQMYMNMVQQQQPQAAMYQTPAGNIRQQPVPGHVSQGYYGIQRVVPDVYRDQPVYSVAPPQMQQQPPAPQPQITKMMVGDTGGGYTTAQVGYDSSGRQVYYAATGAVQPGGGPVGVVPSSYPTAVTTMSVDPRQTGTLTQEGKVVKPPQASV